jgi:hypothetical protein
MADDKTRVDDSFTRDQHSDLGGTPQLLVVDDDLIQRTVISTGGAKSSKLCTWAADEEVLQHWPVSKRVKSSSVARFDRGWPLVF